MEELEAVTALRRAAKDSADAVNFFRHLHTWFDAFRTLKMIHWLTNRWLPRRELGACLRDASFLAHSVTGTEDLELLRQNLYTRELQLSSCRGIGFPGWEHRGVASAASP